MKKRPALEWMDEEDGVNRVEGSDYNTSADEDDVYSQSSRASGSGSNSINGEDTSEPTVRSHATTKDSIAPPKHVLDVPTLEKLYERTCVPYPLPSMADTSINNSTFNIVTLGYVSPTILKRLIQLKSSIETTSKVSTSGFLECPIIYRPSATGDTQVTHRCPRCPCITYMYNTFHQPHIERPMYSIPTKPNISYGFCDPCKTVYIVRTDIKKQEIGGPIYTKSLTMTQCPTCCQTNLMSGPLYSGTAVYYKDITLEMLRDTSLMLPDLFKKSGTTDSVPYTLSFDQAAAQIAIYHIHGDTSAVEIRSDLQQYLASFGSPASVRNTESKSTATTAPVPTSIGKEPIAEQSHPGVKPKSSASSHKQPTHGSAQPVVKKPPTPPQPTPPQPTDRAVFSSASFGNPVPYGLAYVPIGAKCKPPRKRKEPSEKTPRTQKKAKQNDRVSQEQQRL